jgi:hypothetical protein
MVKSAQIEVDPEDNKEEDDIFLENDEKPNDGNDIILSTVNTRNTTNFSSGSGASGTNGIVTIA